MFPHPFTTPFPPPLVAVRSGLFVMRFCTSEPRRAYYGTPIPSVIFFVWPKKKIWVRFRSLDQESTSEKTSVCLYVLSVCLSSSSSPIFSVLIWSDPHKIWRVCSWIHNLEVVFFFEIFIYIDFIRYFVFLGLSQFLRWITDYVKIEIFMDSMG